MARATNKYEVHEAFNPRKGRRSSTPITIVEAEDLTSAAASCQALWPCYLTGDHLPHYVRVDVNDVGTLDFIRPEPESKGKPVGKHRQR